MQKAANVGLWLAKYAGGGLVSYAAPRLAVGAGIPLDTWFITMGGWFTLSISREMALNTASVLIGAALLAVNHWGTRAGRQAIMNRLRGWAGEIASWRVRVERVGTPALAIPKSREAVWHSHSETNRLGPRLEFGSPVQRAKEDTQSFWHVPIKVRRDARAPSEVATFPGCKVFLDLYKSGSVKDKIRMCWGDLTFESPRDFEELTEGRASLVPVAWRTESGDDRNGYFADARLVKDRSDRMSRIPANRRKNWFRLRVVGRDFEIQSPHFYLVRCPTIRSNGHFIVEMEYEGEGTQSTDDAPLDAQTLPSPSPSLRPHYAADEIDKMLNTLRELQGVLDTKCRPAHAALVEITQRWEPVLHQWGARETSTKLKPVRDAVRASEKELDNILTSNRYYWAELHSAIYDSPNPPGHGLDSAINMLVDDLDELAGGQNVNVSKWARPRFDETAKLGIRYCEWIGQADERIAARTNELREMRRTA